jgi:hypothetical protein
MSKNFTLTLLLSIILIIAGVEFAKSFLKTPAGNSRFPASVGPGKSDYLGKSHDRGISHTEKVSGPIRTQIQLNSDETLNEIKSVIGVVTVTKPMQNVLVRWQLPEGAKILSGHREIVVAQILPDRPYELAIQIESPTLDKTQINLLASATMGSMRTSHGSQLTIVAGSNKD